MLALPATTEQGLQQSAFKPVVYAELVTGLLDNPQVTQADWNAATAQLATQVVAEQGVATDPLAAVQLAYPDGSRVEDGFSLVGSKNIRTKVLQPGPSLVIGVMVTGPFTGQAFQSFRLSRGEQSSYPVSQVSVRLARTGAGTTAFDLELVIYSFRSNDGTVKPDIATFDTVDTFVSASRSSSSISTTMSDETFTFSTPIMIVRDRQYAASVRVKSLGGKNFHAIEWEGYVGLGLAPRERGGSTIFNTTSDLVSGKPNTFVASDEGYELSLKVKVPTYVWDGTNTAYRDVVIDLGSTPTDPGYFDFSYRTPRDTRVRFRAWGSATGAFGGEETDLGVTDTHTQADDRHHGAGATHVHDGDPITVLRRYYKIRAELLGASTAGQVTQSLLHTPSVHGVNVVFPTKIHKFATHPVLDALPAISSVPSLSTRIDLKGYTAQAQTITPELADLAGYATDPAVEVNLKNLPLEIRFGVIPPQGLTTKHQLAPYAFGKVQDYSVGYGKTAWITKPWTADLSLKVPQPNRRDRDAALIPIGPEQYGDHIIDALDHLLFSEARIPRRYKHAQSFIDAKTFLTANWITKRVITESTELRTLVNQLLEVIGHFLVQDEEGKLKLIRYPRSGNAVDTWGDAELLPGTMQEPSFDDSIINMAMVFYGHPQADGREFAPDPKVAFDPTSIQDWAPGSQGHVADRLIKGYWLPGLDPTTPAKGGNVRAEEIAKRIVKHASNGIIRITCETHLSQYAVQVGDFVNLQTPVFLRKGTKGSMKAAQKFMVASKTVDVFGGSIKWELVEARDSNRPPTGSISVNISSGVAPFSVTVTTAFTDPDSAGIAKIEIDHDYDGSVFQADQTNTSGSGSVQFVVNYGSGTAGRKVIAVRATDTDGGTALRTLIVRAIVAPVAQIDIVTQQAPGQPMNVTLSGAGSTSRSSQIVKYEWDIAYTGTFAVDAEGVQTTISMPFRETTIALRVTDQDGQTNTTTLLLTGKQLAPADVTNFLVQQQGDRLVFSWAPVSDQDIDGYEIRAKYEPTGSLTATWTTADLMTPDGSDTLIKVTMAILPAPRPYGTWAFFIKAKDQSTNYSANATSILMNTAKPGDRFVLRDWNELDDSANWADAAKTSNLTYEVATLTWHIASGGQVLGGLPVSTLGSLPVETLGSLGTLAAEGIYTCESHDLGSVINGFRLSVLPIVHYLGNPEQTNFIIEARTATDGVPTWGSWFKVSIADLSARWFQVRIKLQQFDGSSNVGIMDVRINVDLPVVVQSKQDIDVSGAGSGTTWTFDTAFQVTPRISHAIQSIGTTAVYLDVTAKSKTAVTVKVRRTSDGVDIGSGGTKLVDLTAVGA